MPVHNTASYLAEAVESILAQTEKDFEFVIIDDGSTDGSLEILRRYEREDQRIRVISRENRGLVKTRNELLREAKGGLVVWADSDDVSYPNRLEKQAACFADAEVVWVTASMRLVDWKRRALCVFRPTNDPGATGASMMRREAAMRVGGFREEMQIAEDRDLELRLRALGKVLVVPDVLLDYRQHRASVCNSSRMLFGHYIKLADRLAEERRVRGSDAIQRGERVSVSVGREQDHAEALWATYSRWAWWALNGGNQSTARLYATKVLLYRPWSLGSWRLAVCAARGY